MNLEDYLIRQNSCIPKRKFNLSIRLQRTELARRIHSKSLCIILQQHTKAWDLGNILHDLIVDSYIEHAKEVACMLELKPPILYENHQNYLKDAKSLARIGEVELARQLTVRGISVMKELVVSAQKAFDLIQLMVSKGMEKEAREYTWKLFQYDEPAGFYSKAGKWAEKRGWEKESMDLYAKAIEQKNKSLRPD